MRTALKYTAALLTASALVACEGDEPQATGGSGDPAAQAPAMRSSSPPAAPAEPVSGEVPAKPVVPAAAPESGGERKMQTMPVPEELYPVDPAPTPPPER